MYRVLCLLVAGFVTAVSLISMAAPAAAEGNCPQGATCNCVPTTFTKCKADAQGRQYDCQTYKGEKCTVVSGPGSGTKALQPAQGIVTQSDQGTGTPPDRGTAIQPKQVAPAISK
jgi:hypothetical protein